MDKRILPVSVLVIGLGIGIGVYLYTLEPKEEDDEYTNDRDRKGAEEKKFCGLGYDGEINGEKLRIFDEVNCAMLGGRFMEPGYCFKTGLKGGSWSFDCYGK